MNSNPAIDPAIGTGERTAYPAQRPRFVHGRADAVGSEKSPTEAVGLLVVEDDFLLATEIEATLRDAGYDVGKVASSAEDALNAAASRPFALAVMDVRLANRTDGIDCAFELFKRHNLRCIFATAHYDGGTRRRAEPAQPLGWLHKPYTMSSLISTVHNALDRLGKKY